MTAELLQKLTELKDKFDKNVVDPQGRITATEAHMARERPFAAAPIALLKQEQLVPTEYVFHIHSQQCKNCGTRHEWCEAYSMNWIRTSSSTFRHLVPTHRFQYNIPKVFERLQTKEVPACQECLDTLNLSGLPVPASPQKVVVSGARDILEEPKVKKAKEPTRSAIDLLGDL